MPRFSPTEGHEFDLDDDYSYSPLDDIFRNGFDAGRIYQAGAPPSPSIGFVVPGRDPIPGFRPLVHPNQHAPNHPELSATIAPAAEIPTAAEAEHNTKAEQQRRLEQQIADIRAAFPDFTTGPLPEAGTHIATFGDYRVVHFFHFRASEPKKNAGRRKKANNGDTQQQSEMQPVSKHLASHLQSMGMPFAKRQKSEMAEALATHLDEYAAAGEPTEILSFEVGI
ncbi:hypothetical protein HDV05_005127 [Chytridiales sp. JEL 0842]|nr:hypothetical protein HDV05_005127 [Chytridiales sp. JEL 0842]